MWNSNSDLTWIIWIIILAIVLFLGTIGFRRISGFDWIDSFQNATYHTTGLGQANLITTPEGKIFSSLYALFSGLFFFATLAFIVERSISIAPE